MKKCGSPKAPPEKIYFHHGRSKKTTYSTYKKQQKFVSLNPCIPLSRELEGVLQAAKTKFCSAGKTLALAFSQPWVDTETYIQKEFLKSCAYIKIAPLN
ncbi:MAG: hypothetical protein KDC82_00585 [Bacteroidetes bacterium]|nr:hypothetical protein [Bacteroidota bacterium]